MELRAGFKQTDVGVIPEDWEVKPISDIISLMTNGFVGTVKSHYTESDEGILYIQGYNVEENSFNFHGIKRITHEFHNQHSKSCLQEGDLLTVQTGDIGVTTVIPKELEGANCHALIITRFKKGKADPRFYSYYFNFSAGRRRLKEIETGSTMKHINGGDMKLMLMPYPTKAEQSAIATALSDTDAFVSSLEKLIAKKRNIKQGAMQKLLQPKEDWEVKKIDEIAEVKSGKRLPLGYSLTEHATSHPYIRILDMSNGGISLKDLRFIPEDVFPFIKNYRIFKDDIYISVAGTLGLVGRIPEVLDGANLTENANRLTNIKCNIDYLLIVLKSDLIQNKIEAERTLGAQPKLALIRIRNFEIPLPSPIEQNQIANILSEMEEEIASLESKLEKYKNIKLGMMQTLLTGKIRLV